MPGGRLTQQERQQIALGLADDLAYAEIARRLDRPTSTVTREVLRNGGPAGYRADLAHRATEHRAHRRSGAAPARDPRRADRPDDGRDPAAVDAFEETITTVFMHSGLSRMPARVLAALLLTDSGTLTATELADRLRVSPASISKAVAFLDEQSMIRRERDERRRERYQVDEEIWYQSAVASAHSNAEVAATARQGVAVLGTGTPAGERLENVARFLDHLSEMLLRAAEQARELLSARPAPEPGEESESGER
ncbi:MULTISPECIES: helix-turn-helix domain-containing protein [Kitasatospora]|uniref:Putative MarR family transcriptional regulator n=1 Tax=Kitasatospora setae (strain ATCC 33774 / DSM 43861 / JCM 3304 / KCC A-0304 / NBRC 14216 / KM-6054) TaxID=452652 RepID=E4NE63_KITSK|nr:MULTISPECIES: helix-turn-helix domain-containing protein [Kitasatospora]BAJ29494.1 putative MarR family transcriptional regulator [Kitasatospora setae KM-6054]